MNILFTDDYSKKLIYIGERVAIAPMVHIIAVSYPNNSLLRKINEFDKKGKVYINNDCWIGANAVILPDISIGKCSVIAAGAVVTKNVDDYSIVGGIPAKKIGDVREKQGWENIFNKL